MTQVCSRLLIPLEELRNKSKAAAIEADWAGDTEKAQYLWSEVARYNIKIRNGQFYEPNF